MKYPAMIFGLLVCSASAAAEQTATLPQSSRFHKSSHGELLFGTHAARGQQSLAEACAKHLQEFIEKGR
jgi:hypothetical protein